jgi:hypothetical protein
MASRERKRAQRQKRKRRASERREAAATTATPSASANGDGSEDFATRMATRAEARNEAARAELEPLAEDDRPTVVTVGAIIAVAIAVASVIGYAAGVEVTTIGSDGIEQGEDEAPIASVLAVVALMGVTAWGMWRARYWAVLGFQALLVIALVGAALALVQTTDWLQAVWLTLLIAGAGAMFYLMIKAMARIQMPQRVPRD